MKKKVATIVLSLILYAVFASTVLSQEAMPQLKVEIYTFGDSSDPIEKNCFKVGDRVNVKVTITNLSDRNIGIPMGIDFSRPTLFRNGEIVSYLKDVDEKWKKYPGGGVRGIMFLKPDETKSETVELGDAYKQLAAGEYQLSLEKRVFKGGKFSSNAVIFKVACDCNEP